MNVLPEHAIKIRLLRVTFGVYLLLDCDEVVYVGQSESIEARVVHHSKKGKRFNSFVALECQTIDEMNELEERLIALYRPKYNTAGIKRRFQAPRLSRRQQKVIESYMRGGNK